MNIALDTTGFWSYLNYQLEQPIKLVSNIFLVMDQSYNLKNWCIMADSKLLTAGIHKKKDGRG